jgi:Bacterial regulatory proteins, luxR family
LLCRGADNRYIARSLFIAEKTVRNHVSNIFTKLGVTHRAEAAARARDAGLGGRDRIGTPAPCARDIRQMTLSPAAHIRISNAPRRS